MRSAGRRLSGGSADESWRCRKTKATSAKGSSESIKDGIRTGVCGSGPWIVRSGILAFGKEVSGQPLQSDASCISICEETRLFECPSILSRAQIEMQATNSHMKLIGSSAAINLLTGKHVINISKIIHIQFALRHSETTTKSLSGVYRCASRPHHRVKQVLKHFGWVLAATGMHRGYLDCRASRRHQPVEALSL